MPYISEQDRERLAAGQAPTSAGELNFMISRLIDDYLQGRGGLAYARINEVVGVLECAKLELYRRLAAPYEDAKLATHGEVYDVLES